MLYASQLPDLCLAHSLICCILERLRIAVFWDILSFHHLPAEWAVSLLHLEYSLFLSVSNNIEIRWAMKTFDRKLGRGSTLGTWKFASMGPDGRLAKSIPETTAVLCRWSVPLAYLGSRINSKVHEKALMPGLTHHTLMKEHRTCPELVT